MLGSSKLKNWMLLLITLTAIVIIFLIEPIWQDQNYHAFKDYRGLFGIQNFWNVVSNVPLLLTGFIGMLLIIKQRQLGIYLMLSKNSFMFFLGIFFTGLSSSYYHLHPSNTTLLWDRLPMTVSFMSFLSIIIGEFICKRSGKQLLFPLFALGLLSIIYWQLTEKCGCGDLRFYVLIQFLPLILIPLIILLYKNEGINKTYYWLILLFYAVAKWFELTDEFIFNLSNTISGHTLKHFAAAIAPLIYLKILCDQKGFEKLRMMKQKL